MAPTNLPGYLYPPEQQTGLLNQQPAQQQPTGFLGIDFSQANIPLALAGASMIGSNKRLGAAIPDAVKMYAMGQSLMNDKEKKDEEKRKLQGMTQWYSQPKFIDQFGPEFGKLAQEYPQFAHEIYRDTLRPQGSSTGAVQNWEEYNRILREQGPEAAQLFKDEFAQKRGMTKQGDKYFGTPVYDEQGNVGLLSQTGQGVQWQDTGGKKVLSPAEQAAAKQEAKDTAKLKASMPQAKLSRDTAVDNLNELASRAEEIMNHPGLERTTGIYSAFPSIPGGAAADVEAKINTLKTQVFIGVIGAMREASKTGGAVGQVTEREMAKLEGAWAALQQSQGTAAYKDELRKLIDRAKLSMQRINEAYQEQYGNISVELPATGQTSGNTPQADPLGIRQ